MLCYSGILQKYQHAVCWVKGMIWEKMCCMEMCVQVQACRHDCTVDINYKRLQKILKKTWQCPLVAKAIMTREMEQ